MARSKRVKYAADFEATTKIEDCRIWGWGVRNIYNLDEHYIGHTMDEFMNFMLTKDGDFYFHNLKYDGSFILNYLFQKKFRFSRAGRPQPGTFNTTISKGGAWYMIDITTGYEASGRRKHVVVYDSLKKLPFPVKTIAKAFELPILKGDIDYNKERPIGYIMDDEERAYINNDVEIMARSLRIQFDQGLTGMTIGQDAISDFKSRIGSKNFPRIFPELDLKIDEKIRKAYKGGYTYLKKIEGNKIHRGGKVYDINSLYPSVMLECHLPWGRPIEFTGEYKTNKNYPLFTQRFSCEFELKDGYLPMVQIKGNTRFVDTEYLESSNGEPVELNMTSVDLTLFLEHYEVYNETWLDGFMFQSKRGFFDDYIHYWNDIKVKNTEGMPGANAAIRTLAKLMLNNLYGKFGKNPDVTPKIPKFNVRDHILQLKDPRDEDGFLITEEDDPVYIPMGAFITAYARNKTIRAAQKCYDRFIYADTDSLHLKGTEIPESLADDIHPAEIGKWKHEYDFTVGKFVRQKTYVEQYLKKGKLVTEFKCAGMPDRIKETYTETHYELNESNTYSLKKEYHNTHMPKEVKELLTIETFKIGFHASWGKMRPVQTTNGVVLVDTPYTLK